VPPLSYRVTARTSVGIDLRGGGVVDRNGLAFAVSEKPVAETIEVSVDACGCELVGLREVHEHRGDVPEELREGIGEWLFGCDVCQEVCPWTRKARPGRDAALAPAGPLGPLEALLGLDRDAFRARFRHTPLWRAKRAGLLRNAALVLGNRGDARAAPALERALDDEDETVRHAAAWALERLRRLE